MKRTKRTTKNRENPKYVDRERECFTVINEDLDLNMDSPDKKEEDIALLVESLKSYQTLDPYVRKEAFSALRTLLSIKTTQDFFRELQGVELMISIYQDSRTKDQDKDVMENALFTLGVAVERNDVSRNALLTPEVFKLIKGAMKNKSTCLLTSAYLLLCLVSNNGDGQSLARTTKCIHKLCDFLKKTVADKDDTEQSSKICNAICSTLCAANIDPINGKIQTHLCKVGGIRAMVALLKKYSSADHTLQNTEDNCFVTQLINTLSCSYVSHVANQMHAVELGTVEILLTYLQLNVTNRIPAQLQINCITALVSLLDSDGNELGKQKFQENRGVAILIEILATTKDEKFKKLVTFLLHKTYNDEGIDTQPPTFSSNINTVTQKIASRDKMDTIKDTTSDIQENHSVNDDASETFQDKDEVISRNKYADEKERCGCKNTLAVDSLTVLKVLLVNSDVCGYHNDIGQTLQKYITMKRKIAPFNEQDKIKSL